MPLLSLDQLEELNCVLHEQYYNQSEVNVKYFYKDEILNKNGIIIKLDSAKKILILNNNFKIHFSQVIEIN